MYNNALSWVFIHVYRGRAMGTINQEFIEQHGEKRDPDNVTLWRTFLDWHTSTFLNNYSYSRMRSLKNMSRHRWLLVPGVAWQSAKLLCYYLQAIVKSKQEKPEHRQAFSRYPICVASLIKYSSCWKYWKYWKRMRPCIMLIPQHSHLSRTVVDGWRNISEKWHPWACMAFLAKNLGAWKEVQRSVEQDVNYSRN